MKTPAKFLTFALFFFIFLNLIPSKILSQLQFFDSVTIVASSPDYDYKNPVFESNNSNLLPATRLVYERHYGNASDIIFRTIDFNGFSSEFVITNTQNSLNINPSFSENILVWQSNSRGSWDIYFSYFSGSSWSTPQILDSSSLDETNPYLINNHTFPVEYNYYYLAYKRNDDIRFKRFKTSTLQWDKDTIVTPDTPEECITPLISRTSASTYGIIYLKKYSDLLTKINIRTFIESVSGNITWNNPYEVSQPNTQKNLSVIYGNSEYLTYDYDTLGTSHSVGFQVPYENFKEVFTKNIPGKHSTAGASTMGIVTENLQYFFTVFGCNTVNYDSSMITLAYRLNNFSLYTTYKRIYLGDTTVKTRFGLSPAVFNSFNLFKIRLVWEKNTGGRTALMGSSMTDVLGGVSENNSTVNNFMLHQNYPNPFNPKTKIEYELQLTTHVNISVFDIQGKEVKTMIDEKQNEGKHQIEFDGINLPSGIYFYSLKIGNSVVDTKKMILIR